VLVRRVPGSAARDVTRHRAPLSSRGRLQAAAAEKDNKELAAASKAAVDTLLRLKEELVKAEDRCGDVVWCAHHVQLQVCSYRCMRVWCGGRKGVDGRICLRGGGGSGAEEGPGSSGAGCGAD
jgi:hypothetical protein